MSDANEMVNVEVWILIDETGDYVAHVNQEDLASAWQEVIGDPPELGVATRVVKVTLTVPKPRAVELAATVAAEPDGGKLEAI